MNFEQFNARINDLWAQTKAGKLPRADRFSAISSAMTEYVLKRMDDEFCAEMEATV